MFDSLWRISYPWFHIALQWLYELGTVNNPFHRLWDRGLSKVKWRLLSHVWLCDPMDYTVHGNLQVRILEWVAFPFSRGSSQPRDWTLVSRIAGGFFTSWVTREACYILRCIKLNIWDIEMCGGNMNGPRYLYIFLRLLNKLPETQHTVPSFIRWTEFSSIG